MPSFVSPIGKVNTVTYYLINTFTSKSLLGKGGQGEDLFGYRDFVQFKLYQTYDINAAQGTYTTTIYSTRTAPPSLPLPNPFPMLSVNWNSLPVPI